MNKVSATKPYSLLLVSVILCFTAWAEDLNQEPVFVGKALTETGADKIYDGKALSPAQLESCITDGLYIDDQKINLLAKERTNRAANRKLTVMENVINNMKVSERNLASVKRYNKKLTEYDKAYEKTQRGNKSWSTGVQQYNVQVVRLNTKCAGKDFYEEDLNHIKQRVAQLPSIFNNLKTII